MIEAVVIDIEGTVGPLSFVRQALFPWARARLRGHVTARRHERAVADIVDGARRELGQPDAPDEAVIAALERWSDEDRKVTPLKALQGLIWEEGYRSGHLRGALFADVAPVLRAWRARGLRLYVYSSGSAHAQRLYFGFSEAGDLTPLFQGHYDTTVGPKVEPASYRAIAESIGLPPDRVLFLSDSAAELDAAASAGMHAIALAREGAPALAAHPTAASLEEIRIDSGAPWVAGRGLAARAKELAALGRLAAGRGWALATSGNFSARLDDGRVAITGSGLNKAELDAADMVVLELDGRVVAGQRKPSAETPLHLALYRWSDRIGAIGHTHSPAATVLSRRAASAGVLRLQGYEMAKAFEGVRSHEEAIVLPVVPNSQDMAALAAALEGRLAELPDARGYLVAGHGLTTWAPDVASLLRHLEALEHMLACELASAVTPP